MVETKKVSPMCSAENLPRYAHLYHDVEPIVLYAEKARWDEEYQREAAEPDAATDRAFADAAARVR